MPDDTLNVAELRSKFPALAEGIIFADNAGGSQCLNDVAIRVSDYILQSIAPCEVGARRFAEGCDAVRELFNAASRDEIVFGSSSTSLMENLARGMEDDFLDGEEIIITGEHEANAGPWKKLAARKGLVVKVWYPTRVPDAPNNPYFLTYDLGALLPLLTPRTRLVAFSACSNILGSVIPVKEVTAAVRARASELGCRKVEVCVDCVAYAPHRRVDVLDWDIDYCVISMYKVYGPRVGTLYARASCVTQSLQSVVHHFLPLDDKAYKIQPGAPCYELVYGLTAISAYLRSFSPTRSLADTFLRFALYEQTLVTPLLTFLKSKEQRGVRIVGDERPGPSRVPTISFVVVGERSIKSKDIVEVFDTRGISIPYGHFYAYTLLEHLDPQLDPDDGVVRISLVHYNTGEDVNTIISILEEVLA